MPGAHVTVSQAHLCYRERGWGGGYPGVRRGKEFLGRFEDKGRARAEALTSLSFPFPRNSLDTLEFMQSG